MNRSKDTALAIILITLGLIFLNFLPSALVTNIVGLIFLIAGIYGLLAVMKKCRFIFN